MVEHWGYGNFEGIFQPEILLETILIDSYVVFVDLLGGYGLLSVALGSLGARKYVSYAQPGFDVTIIDRIRINVGCDGFLLMN